jgi:hypothetical protein
LQSQINLNASRGALSRRGESRLIAAAGLSKVLQAQAINVVNALILLVKSRCSYTYTAQERANDLLRWLALTLEEALRPHSNASRRSSAARPSFGLPRRAVLILEHDADPVFPYPNEPAVADHAIFLCH